MKTYILRVALEPDEDGWLAYCPALVKCGVATWGCTPKEALQNLQEVADMVLADLVERQDPIPEGTAEEICLSPELRVAVTV